MVLQSPYKIHGAPYIPSFIDECQGLVPEAAEQPVWCSVAPGPSQPSHCAGLVFVIDKGVCCSPWMLSASIHWVGIHMVLGVCMQPFVLRQWLASQSKPSVLSEVMGLLETGVIRPYCGKRNTAMRTADALHASKEAYPNKLLGAGPCKA